MQEKRFGAEQIVTKVREIAVLCLIVSLLFRRL